MISQPIPMQEIARLFFGQGGGLVIVIRAAFDASMDTPAGVTAVAGHIGRLEDWEEVERKWNAALEARNMQRFRLTEVFYRYHYDEAVNCALEFADIISQSKLRSAWAFMLDTDWSGLLKSKEYAEIYPERQHACLDLLLTTLGQDLDLEFKGQPTAVVFDNDYGNTQRAAKVYDAWCLQNDHDGFGSVSFIKGKDAWDVVPLQCADLLAGSIRRDPLSKSVLGIGATVGSFKPHSISTVKLKAQGRGGRGATWSLALAKEVEEKIKAFRASEEKKQP